MFRTVCSQSICKFPYRKLDSQTIDRKSGFKTLYYGSARETTLCTNKIYLQKSTIIISGVLNLAHEAIGHTTESDFVLVRLRRISCINRSQLRLSIWSILRMSIKGSSVPYLFGLMMKASRPRMPSLSKTAFSIPR